MHSGRREAANRGITRIPAEHSASPTLQRWTAEQRLLIAGQASMLGKILSRTVRRFLNEQELLFPAPR